MISELPRYWITSLFNHEKKQFTALDGVFSVFFATMAVCLLSQIIGYFQKFTLNVSTFAFNVLVLPAAALAVGFLLVLSIRIASSFFNGKGTIGEEWRAVAPSLGSLIFVSGTFCIVWMGIFGIVETAAIGEIPEGTVGYLTLLGKAGTIFPLMGVFIGVAAFVVMYLFGAVQGYWLENLKGVENVEMHKLSKIIWAAIGITLLVLAVIALIIIGLWISSQMEAMLAGQGLGGLQ